MRVNSIHIYPIKSCAGICLTSALCKPYGLSGDRRFVVVDKGSGAVLTQRDLPAMALIQPALTTSGLELTAPNMPPLAVPSTGGTTSKSGITYQVDVWGRKYLGRLTYAAADDWLNEFLGRSCSLVQNEDSHTAFVDAAPVLIVSHESLVDLNQRLENQVAMNRFRPSIVIEGLGAYQEHEQAKLTIGESTFIAVKPCGRCVIVTIDQELAKVTVVGEPLKTLSQYRISGKKVIFGHYFQVETAGQVKVGDSVSPA